MREGLTHWRRRGSGPTGYDANAKKGGLRPRLLGLGGALALLTSGLGLAPTPALAAAVESCSPTPKVATSFCVSYDSSVSSTVAHSPVDASFSISDTSTGFPNDKTTWMDLVTLHLTSGTTPPRITPSAQMPNGLLITGGGPCTAPNFTDCAAGNGTFVADIHGTPFGVEDGIHSGFYGITEIENVNPPASGAVIQWALHISWCLHLNFLNSTQCGTTSTTVSGGSAGSSIAFSPSQTFSQFISACTCTITGDATLGSINANLHGRSNMLAAGTSAGGMYTILMMPFSCGATARSADFRSRDARAVTVQLAPVTITGCAPAWAVLPAMTNGAYGGYVTAATIKNVGTAPASVSLRYFDQTGNAVGAGDTIASLPVNGSWTVRQDNGNSFPSSGGNAVRAGSAVVYSTQPVAAFVNEFAPGGTGDATSYTGIQLPDGAATTLNAPAIANNAYGGYTTGIGLINPGSAPTDIQIVYRDAAGTTVRTTTLPGVPAHAYEAFYSGDPLLALPDGFAGTATIVSSAQPVAAVVTEVGPGGRFSSYDATAVGNTRLLAPVALNGAFGGYFTGTGVQNITGTSGTVGVTYFNPDGSTAKTVTKAISANGYLGLYQGDATDGPPASTGGYSAVLTPSAGLFLAAIVNEVAPAGAPQSTSYNTFGFGLLSGQLPLVESSGSDGWSTGLGIMNTGGAATTVTVSYYDTVTGAPLGTPFTSASLAPNAFLAVYQPTAGLPAGSRATAVVTGSSVDAQFALICNESSSTTFMSYDGQ